MRGRRIFGWRTIAVVVLVLAVGLSLALTAEANHSLRTWISAGQINGNGNYDAIYGGVSADGNHAFFTSQEQLVPTDTDNNDDVYERFNGTTTEVSAGQINGNGAFNAQFRGNSGDGLHVYFETREKLVSADTDNQIDVYERYNGATTLVSQGPGNFNTTTDSFYLGNSADGTKVFFSSYDPLTASDTDGGYRDVYMRSGGVTTQISTGGNGPYGADFDGMTPDGSHIYFHTDERLTPATDTDSAGDIYDASGGSIAQVSTGPSGGNGGQIPVWQGATPDGSHVYFQTVEQLTPTDTDAYLDVYDRSGGTTTQVSLGQGSSGNGPWDASFSGASADGSKVWFMTREAMDPTDMDGGCEDSLGNPTLPCLDVYERSGGNTTWISTGGNGPYEAFFAAASVDGSNVFFETEEPLTADDQDAAQDIFQRSPDGTLTRISTGAVGGNGPYGSDLVGISDNGARVFFHTYESLDAQDNDGNWQDVYERYSGETTLISTGPAANNAAAVAIYHGQTADGTTVFFQTDEHLVSSDTDQAEDIYSASQVVAGFPRPKGASPATFALVPAYQQCQSPNTSHGPSLSYGSCKPPTQESSILTVGTPDADGRQANMVDSIKFRVVSSPSSNVVLNVKINDVLCRATNAACPGIPLSDYTGQLLIRAKLKITDKYNGSPKIESATGQSFDLQFPIQCTATTGTPGADCSGATSVNGLYPGAVLAGQRAIWEVQKLDVLDPGPNGTGFGAGCPTTCGDGDESVFLRAGLFVP